MRRPLLVTTTTLTLLLTSGGVVFAGDGAEKPSAGAFEPAGSLAEARWNHTLTLLRDGRVLVIGGQGEGEFRHAAEVWDPATASFNAAGSLSDIRVDYIPTLLPDGRVLVADCCNPGEVWDPAKASFGPPGPLSDVRTGNGFSEFRLLRRSNHTGTLLPDGRVLIIGGSNPATFEFPAEAQVIDAVAGSLEPAGSLARARHFHTATLLRDGRVLVVGGSGLGGGLGPGGCVLGSGWLARRGAPDPRRHDPG